MSWESRYGFLSVIDRLQKMQHRTVNDKKQVSKHFLTIIEIFGVTSIVKAPSIDNRISVKKNFDEK